MLQTAQSEFWIWTELLAFDNQAPDGGVQAYCERIGRIPDGIFLLVSHQDFVLLHQGMQSESPLAPDYCSRCGHEGNGERNRQDWTNFQLRNLVRSLQKKNIKAFGSVFWLYSGDKFHSEWATSHPAVTPIGFLADGTDFQDLWAKKLGEVMDDYGFDGWHAADAMGPASAINGSRYAVPQNQFNAFADLIGWEKFPAEYHLIPEADADAKYARNDYIWKNWKFEWVRFVSDRWLSFHRKAAAVLHSRGKLHAMNSCCAKSVFESAFYFGLDTRQLPTVPVDYFIIESVATSLEVIHGNTQKKYDIYAQIGELAAALPNAKLLTLQAVHDVVEEWNCIHQYPEKLERDFLATNSQKILKKGEERLCPTGVLYCLGDGLTSSDWQFLRGLYERAFEKERIAPSQFVWLYDNDLYDALMTDHAEYGTLPPYLFVSALLARGVDCTCSCRSDEGGATVERPLFVPDFHLLSKELQERIRHRKAPTVVVGNQCQMAIPEANLVLGSQILPNYHLVCGIWGTAVPKTPFREIPAPVQEFDSGATFSFVRDRCPSMQIPEEFFDGVAALMKSF